MESARVAAPVGETYIVRIYRRDAKHPRRIVGVVEKVNDREEHPFRTAAELTGWIVRAGRPSGRER